MLSARRYCAPASLRAASYSANPPRKNGTLEDLVYNDALYRGRRPGKLSLTFRLFLKFKKILTSIILKISKTFFYDLQEYYKSFL